MENENKENEVLKKDGSFAIPLPVAIIIAGAMLSGAWVYNIRLKIPSNSKIGIRRKSIADGRSGATGHLGRSW